MILSYQAARYGCADTLNSKIHPLFQILDTDPGWCKNSGNVACKNSGGAAGAGAAAAAGVHCLVASDCKIFFPILTHYTEYSL